MRRVFASVLLAVCAFTAAIAASAAAPNGISPPHPVAVYTGPTHESLNVTLKRIAFEQSQIDAWNTAVWNNAVWENAVANNAARNLPRHPQVRGEQTVVDTPAPSLPDSGDVVQIIRDVFGNNAEHAIHIASCESGLDPNARNRSGASGLFQIMMPMHADMFNDPSDVFNPYENARAAYELSNGGTNWSAWVCR